MDPKTGERDEYVPTPEEQAAADQRLGRHAEPHDVEFLKEFNFL